MTINGKEVHFRATVGAMMKIARLCKDHDINNAEQLFTTDTMTTLENTTKFISYLSGGTLTEEEILEMDIEEFTAVQTEAMSAFRRDQKGEVNVVPKKEKAAEPVPEETTA